MSTKYFALLTRLGADKLANAAALGTKLEITQMAVGDGGGSLPTPHTTQAQLINERRRAAINVLSIDPKNTNQIVAEQVIPESEGGWWIREIGLFDKDGILIAVGNCAETYKPQLQEGSGRTQTIRMVLIVSSTNAVTLKIDPAVVLATREYVDSRVTNSIKDHENSRRHPDATLKDKGFVILSSAVDSHSETQAATPKAVAAVYSVATAANQNAVNANNNASSRLEKSKNGADIPEKNVFMRNIGAQPAGDYADKSASNKQIFSSFVSSSKGVEADDNNGNRIGMYTNDGRVYFAVHRNNKWLGDVECPGRGGTMALQGDSYTKEEANSRYQSAGNYADKSADNKQAFNSFVSSLRGIEAGDDNGNLIGIYANKGHAYFTAHKNGKWIGDVGYPNRSGTMALREDVLGMASYRNVLRERKLNFTYINYENRPIFVSCTVDRTGSYRLYFIVDGVTVAEDSRPPGVEGGRWAHHISAIVPAGASYRLDGNGDPAELTRWMEL